ncbi:sensor domain-containing diguanylate cyclase [Shewanella algae]|uniref:sensor domain-containing diguanylate cyclase n=1 Tax=Shewanella algae TaxID=38313 RepID=UPI001182FF00|nr:sensor domain-containing diguanylate cyclase [Shewanella algae]
MFAPSLGISLRETPRDQSFCGHAILSPESMLIPDTLKDPRFADNPLVTGAPHIRFYAGYPLTMRNGCRVGTFCIIDVRPRELSQEDKLCLEDLGHMVENELQHMEEVCQDELTGVANRRGFELLGEMALSSCCRESFYGALLYLDLNEFKPINDTYGHSEGDAVLQAFAAMLVSCFRESDVVARLGGDEFAVLLTHLRPLDVRAIKLRFRKALAELNFRLAKPYQIRASLGEALYDPAQPRSLAELMPQADGLMYRRKPGRD